MDKAQYTACPDLRHSPRNSPLHSAFSTLSASNGSPARGSPQRRTNRSDDSPHGICLLDTQPGTPQPLAAHTETTKSFKLGPVADAVFQSPNKKLYVAYHKRALRRPRELQFEPVPDACNGSRSQATKASAREQQDPHHKIITAVMAAEANKSKMRAEAQTEEKDERARSEEGEDENEEETHRTTTAKPMATTATATTTEYENVDNYFSELIDNGKAEEDHMGWGKPILEKKMPARKNQANQSEKVREAQEKTKRLVAGNDLQDALTGAITTRLVTSTRTKIRTRYDVQEKQEGEQKRMFSPVDPPKISRPRTRQKAEPKPKPKPKPVVITIDDDDSMSQDSFTEVSSAAPPKKRARSDTPSYYSPRVVFGRMDYADVPWEIRWEQAELVIRTVKQLTAADDGEDPFAFDDGDGDYAPDEPKQRNAKRKEKPLERAAPKATEDREFLIPYTDLARVAELTSTGLVAVRTRTILSQIDSNYYDPQNRDGSRHYIHIYCSNWNDWREEWHKVKTILAEASIKVASITEAAYAEFNIGALDQQTVTSSIDSIRRYTTRSMSRKPTTTRRFISTKKIITYPPGRSRDVVTLTQADVERLEPEQLLNDNIIEFYLKYLHEEALFPDNEPQRDQFYFFNTFFWPKLQSLKSEDQMKNLLSWTRNVDIFKKRFLFVPINDGFHWNVVVICNPGSIVHAQTPGAMDKLPKEEWPVMVHMCSLHSTAGHVFNKLRAYLGVAWNADDSRPTIKVTKDSLLGFIPNLPEQQNGSDCGVFLLQYVEGFCRNPPILYTKEDLKVTLNRSWFDNETIVQKRREIKDLIARIACEQEPVTDEPEQAEGPKDEAEAAAANTATTATTPSSPGDAPVKSGSGDEGEAPPSCGGEVEVDVVDEEADRNETRMDPKNEDEDDDDTQMPIERGGVEGHTGAMEVEEAEEGAKAARDDFSLGSDFTPPSPLSLNSAPVSSDDELLKELVEQETDDIMPTSGAARLPSPGLSPPRLTTTREVAMADLDEGEGEGSGETSGMELNVARWIEKRKRKGEERRRGTNKIKKATAGRGGDGERDQPCAVLSVPSSPQSRAEDNENEDEEEEEQGTQKAAGDEGDSYIDIWDLLPRFLLGSDPEVNASKQRNRERDDNDEEEEGEGKTTKRRAKRQKREEDGSSGVEDEAEEAVITAVVPASSSSTGVRGSSVDTAAARPSGRALAASPHRQKVPIGEGGQTVVVDIGEEKEEGEQRKAKEEKEKRAAQSRSRGATGTKGEGWWSKVSGSLGLRSVWPTTTPTAAVGPAGESMHGRQLIPAPLPPPPGQDEDPLLNGRHEEERTMTTPTPTPTSTSTTPTAAAVETTTTSSAENDINSSGSGKRKRRRKRRSKRKQGDGSQADDSAGGSLSSEASLSIDGEGGSPEFHVVYDAVAVADREAAHHAGGRWDTTEVKEEANDGENEQASEEVMRNAVEEGGGKEEGEEASNDNDSGTISDPHPGRLRQANGPRSVAGRTKTKEKGLAMNKVNGTPKPATRTLGP